MASPSPSSHAHELIAFRDTEIFALTRAMNAHRVVVLTGPPGIGKSALALAFAHQKGLGKKIGGAAAATRGSGGAESVVTCRLEGARTEIDVVHEITRVLGIATSANAEASSIAERIGRVLATRRRVLVVLDDVDRSRAALAKLLPGWLREAPTASFLVTARGRIGLTGEHRLEIGPLDVPGAREKDTETIASSPSVQLFARRAAATRTEGFRVTASNARTVASIVRKLEGVPFAIELCASRMVALSERDVAEMLDERLDLLDGKGDGGQRSIRSAFALSWDELDGEDARLLAACSCFRGGFLLDAACAVGSIDREREKGAAKTRVRIARGLERLVEASLVRVVERDEGGERRYALAETLRAFAAEKLAEIGEAATVAERHARHYAGLRTRRPAPGLDVILMERKNLEAAFDRSLHARDPHGSAALLAYAPVALTRGPLAPFIERTGRALDCWDPKRLDLLEHQGPDRDLAAVDRAELLYCHGLGLVFQGKRDEGLVDLEAARGEVGRARALADADAPALRLASRVEALATSKIAVVTGLKGGVGEALSLFDEARASAEASKDDLTQGIVRRDLATILSEAGRNDDAVVELSRARKFLRAAGDTREEGFVLMMLGSRFVDDGRLREARRDCAAALELLRRAGDRRSEAWTLCLLSLVDAEEGDLSSARRQLDTALGLIRDVGDEQTEGLLLGYFGNVALEQGVLADAESAYRDAIVRLARAGDRASEGLFTAAAAVVEYALGRMPSARDGFERARELLEGDGRAARREAVELLARVMEVDAKLDEHDAGEEPRAHRGGDDRPVEEIRFAQRVLASIAARATRRGSSSKDATVATGGGRGLLVGSDGSWVRLPSGEIAKLGAGRPIARVMHQLALERVRHPGRPVPPQSLVRAGWPGERVLPASAKNRLHVTIARLRRLVLEGTLLHDDDGYFLDPKEDTRLADPGEPPR